MGFQRPVRSLTLEPREVVEELPEDLLEDFRAIAEDRYSGLKNPVAALVNEAMEKVLEADCIGDIQEGVEFSKTAHAVLTNVLANETEFSHSDIVQYCTQLRISRYGDGEAPDIYEQAEEIASSIDRSDLWPRFKHQAYELYEEESDEAVLKHMQDAMVLVVYEPALDNIKENVKKEKHITEQLEQFVHEETDFEYTELDNLTNFPYDLSDIELDELGQENTTIDEWVDTNEAR